MKNCNRCGECCKNTCIPTPEDIWTIRKYLIIDEKKGLDFNEFFQKYCIMLDYCDVHDNFNTIYFFKWKSHGQEHVNPYFVARDMNNQHCIFYDVEKGICQIHDVKPKTASQWYCSNDSNPSIEEQIEEWRDNAIDVFLNFIRNMYNINTI